MDVKLDELELELESELRTGCFRLGIAIEDDMVETEVCSNN